MPNGKDYVLFYLKLLVESVDHDGSLRFSDTIPYSEQMLSTITNTNVDVVKSALDVFRGLHLIEVLEDQTIFMDEIQKMLGSETYWAEQKRKQRTMSNECPQLVQGVQQMSKQEKEKELDKELEIDIDDRGGAQSAPPPESIIMLPLNDKSEYPIFQPQLAEWAQLYPAVDVLQELRKMRGWLESNPQKRKTKTGVLRFVNNWLSREQDRGGSRSVEKNKGKTGNPFADRLKEMQNERD
jgi:phage replisome organizer, putative, N-terminal region